MKEFIDSLYVFLWVMIPIALFVLAFTILYFGIYKIYTTKRYFTYIIFVIIGVVLIVNIYRNMSRQGGHNPPPNVDNVRLLINIKNDKPCFYLASLNDAGYEYYIEYIIVKQKIDGKTIWSIDNGLSKKIPLKSIVGENNCFEYAYEDGSHPEKLKKNKTYTAEVYANGYLDDKEASIMAEGEFNLTQRSK